MDGGGRPKTSSPQLNKPCKFAVYQNPTFSAALTANSLQPSKATFLLFFSLSSASAFTLLCIFSRENGLMETMRFKHVPQGAAYAFAKAIQTVVGIVFIGSVFALLRVLSLHRAINNTGALIISSSEEAKIQSSLSSRQLGLMGIKPNVKPVMSESSKKPPKSKPSPCASDVLVPIHQPITISDPKSRVGSDKSNVGSGNTMSSFSTPSKSKSSPTSLYLIPGASSPLPFTQTSPAMDSAVSTPCSGKRAFSSKEIRTEEQLEQFLAEVDEKIIESSSKRATPPPSIRGFGMASPNTVTSPANTSGTTRSTPLRPVRMSPGSQKFTTPP